MRSRLRCWVGIGRGDRVAVWMANHPGWPALYFGILKIGAVLVPLNTRSVADELAFGLVKAGATILFSSVKSRDAPTTATCCLIRSGQAASPS